jgi:hypothetical protein
VSPVRPAAAVAIAAAAAPADSSHGARGVPPVPSRAIHVIVNSDDEEPMHSSVHRARAASPVRAVGCVSAFATRASAGMAPAAPRRFGRQQSNCQVVSYMMDPGNAAHRSSLSIDVSLESGEVMPAAAADISAGLTPAQGTGHSRTPAVDAMPAPWASVLAGRGSRHRPSWLPAGADLPDPNPLALTTAKGIVLRTDVAECVVRQGPVVPCIRGLERWQLDPMEPCRLTPPESCACQMCSGRYQGCVLVCCPSSYCYQVC